MPGLTLLKALWDHRSFVLSSVWLEFSGKSCQSRLGADWSVANRLAMILVYTVVLGQFMRPSLTGDENTPFSFSIYLCAGVITWGLFAETLTRLSSVFLAYRELIKQANFPRICLPVIVACTALLNFLILLALYLAFLALIGHWPGWPMWALVPLLTLQTLFALALGIFLGTLNVFFRKVSRLTGIVLQFWFWLTPVVYVFDPLPMAARAVIQFNPLQPLMAAYQSVFLSHRLPHLDSLLPLALITLFFLFFSAHFFLSRAGDLVDEL